MTEIRFLDELTTFLVSPECQDLLVVHPNHTTSRDFRCPDPWLSWWTWAAEPANLPDSKWLLLWRYYTSPQEPTPDFAQIPAGLRQFIDNARRLQLNREAAQETLPRLDALEEQSRPPTTIPLPNDLHHRNRSVRMQGMSPKKAHEVWCMTAYTSQLLASLSQKGIDIHHVVDIGAGQAYISRALRDELGLDILAVDWSPVQAEGAARKEAQVTVAKEGRVKGSLAYKTLAINKDSLLAVTDEWATQLISTEKPLPVLLLALHACGSLTIDVLRAFCERFKREQSGTWKPVAALVVGCCYNLLRTEDCISLTRCNVSLSTNHLQLAAQVPRHWDRTSGAFDNAKLAIRKVAWRALLEGIITRNDSVHRNGDAKRLGRLNDSAYKTWETFLSVAGKKLGVDLKDSERDTVMESQLEVFHLLRCIVGPVIESFLILDRKVWLGKELKDTNCAVGLLNLFDQRKDSARNVAIVIAPATQAAV